MATQKQRRRRAKEKRHEYVLVEIDAEGNETILTDTERTSSTSSKRESAKATSGGGRQGRSARGVPQPPSWRRVLKRGALFAPIFFATVLLLAGDRLTIAGALVQTLFLLAVFVPFSYFMDRFVWRASEKRRLKGLSGD